MLLVSRACVGAGLRRDEATRRRHGRLCGPRSGLGGLGIKKAISRTEEETMAQRRGGHRPDFIILSDDNGPVRFTTADLEDYERRAEHDPTLVPFARWLAEMFDLVSCSCRDEAASWISEER